MHKFSSNRLLILAVLWIFLWVTPWAIALDTLPWIRLGIGIIIFAVPGVMISLFLLGRRFTLSAHFTSGLAISVLFVGSLGLLGRLFNLPYDYIKPVFALTGLIAIAVLIKHSRSEQQLYKPKQFSFMTLALLLLVIAFGIVANFQMGFGGDDFSYLAYLTNWQHAQPLSFREVMFGSGNPDSVRFWLAMFPMSLAFLAEISNLHGLLLLGFYLEPYLIAISILAIYNLYEDFLENELLTIAALLLHFTFFVLLQESRQPGSTFFARLSEDKVFAAFILAPVLFLALRYFLRLFTVRTGILFFLCGFSMALTHPVILAYSIFICGVYACIVTIMERNYKKLGIALLLLTIMIFPSIFLRFIDGPLTARYAVNLKFALKAYGESSVTRLSYIEGTPFYGFDLERIKVLPSEPNRENPVQTFFSWSYLWLLVLGFLWSLFNLRKKMVAPFIASASFLVLLCGIPYTGWLVGYFVSAGMLWRSPWLLPIGLIGVFLFAELLKFILQKGPISIPSPVFNERVIFRVTSVICVVLIGYFSLHGYSTGSPSIAELGSRKSRLENLAALGIYLEKNIERPSIFVAPLGLMNHLPGLSSKTKVAFFRTTAFTPDSVDFEKIERILSEDPSVPIKQRMNILRKYNIKYILVVDHSFLSNYYASYTKFFRAQKINNFWIIEFQDPNSS